MSADRATRLAFTIAGLGVITLLADRNLTFNGLDLLTIILLGTSVALLAYAKGANNA